MIMLLDLWWWEETSIDGTWLKHMSNLTNTSIKALLIHGLVQTKKRSLLAVLYDKPGMPN
jgi:hypothetical protein